MFDIFKKPKTKETSDFVKWAIFNALMKNNDFAHEIASVTNASTAGVKDWLASLPKIAIDGCQPAMLAAYVLTGDSIMHSKTPNSGKLVDLYLGAAQELVGIVFRSRAGLYSDAELAKLPGTILPGEVTSEEFQLVGVMAKMAKESGLTFNDEVVQIMSSANARK